MEQEGSFNEAAIEFEGIRKEIYTQFLKKAAEEVVDARQEYDNLKTVINKLFSHHLNHAETKLKKAEMRKKLFEEIINLSYRRGPANEEEKSTLLERNLTPSDTKRTLRSHLKGKLPDGSVISITRREHFTPVEDTAKKVWTLTAIEYFGSIKSKKIRERLVTNREADRIYQRYGKILEEIDSATRVQVMLRTTKARQGKLIIPNS